MSLSKLKITTCLWFDGQAEQAAEFYTSVFPNSKILHVQPRIDKAEGSGGDQANDTALLVEFVLDGHLFTHSTSLVSKLIPKLADFVNLNGGPYFKINEAVSFQIDCASQDEVEYYWAKLGEGGDPAKQQCGWLGDKFGVSWQVVPTVLKEMLASEDKEAAARVNEVMMGMYKIDIAGLEKAFRGE